MLIETGFMSNALRKERQRASFRAESRKRASSSTAGKQKGIVATPLQRTACARNRSWRWANYDEVMKSIGKRGKTK